MTGYVVQNRTPGQLLVFFMAMYPYARPVKTDPSFNSVFIKITTTQSNAY